MYANIVQTTEIGRFEKSDQKNKKEKRDFPTSELRSRSKKEGSHDFRISYSNVVFQSSRQGCHEYKVLHHL